MENNCRKMVSIIVPIYNAESYLETTLECLLNQNYEQYEVILVDDKSTDESLRVMQKYKERFSQKSIVCIIVNRGVNGGLCASINSGLEVASGDYYCFPDADDEMAEDYISSMVALFENDTDTKWVRCDFSIVLEDENREYDVVLPRTSVYKNDFWDFISKYVAHNAWNMMVSKEYFKKCIGNQIIDSKLTQEWSLLLPLSYYGNYTRCEKKLYRYHIRSKAMSSWQNRDIVSVIEHINGLEELNLRVIDSIAPSEEDLTSKARMATNLYYHFFRYIKYNANNCVLEANMERESIYELAKNVLHRGIEPWLDMDVVVRIVFDVLLESDTKEVNELYREYRELVKNGYVVVFDKGGEPLIDSIIKIYGVPNGILEFDGTHVDLCNKTVLCLVQNSKKYNQIIERFQNGKNVFLEYRDIRNSIRGWYRNEYSSMERNRERNIG